MSRVLAPGWPVRVLAALALLLCLGTQGQAESDSKRLQVWFVDVGQGDAALIKSPTGKVVLVDAGPRGGDKPILRLLEREGLTQIDLALLTHAHADHIGGFQGVLDTIAIKTALDPGVPHTTATYRNLMGAFKEKAVAVKLARRGRKIGLGGGAMLHILAPEEPLLRGTRSDLNSNSIVALLSYGEVSILFTGDAEGETEARLVAHGDLKPVTVLKVAHHGSEHSTSSRWLKATSPEVGVISCGRNNRYDHPGVELMERLTKAGVKAYRTDQDGTLEFQSDGRAWSLTPLKPRAQTSEAVNKAVNKVAAKERASSATHQTRRATSELIDINTASIEELDTLPGIGPKKAKAIVEHRELKGRFLRVEDLLAVQGIGKGTLRKLREHVHIVVEEKRR